MHRLAGSPVHQEPSEWVRLDGTKALVEVLQDQHLAIPGKNRNWEVLGALKNVKRISYPALVRLVKKEGLPTVPNPFNPGAWAFKQSLINDWYEKYTQGEMASPPQRGPGRPRKPFIP
jgi:hypothetical protein